jgi:hypothetical protein
VGQPPGKESLEPIYDTCTVNKADSFQKRAAERLLVKSGFFNTYTESIGYNPSDSKGRTAIS